MREKEFEHFLSHQYRGERSGRALGERPARDALSRCRRIERVLGIDLDTVVRSGGIDHVLTLMDKAEGRFRFTGRLRTGLSNLRTAVRYYSDFLEGRRKPVRGHWERVKLRPKQSA